MKISIVIVNFNTVVVLADCIKSIYNFESENNFEIIIVDNASQDNSKEIIRQIASERKNIKFIFLDEKKSFSHANNKGIEISTGEFILIMNPDIFFTETLLDKLTQKFSEHENLGAISPALLGTDGKFQRNYFQRYPTVLQFIFFQSLFAKLFFRFPKLMNHYLENQDIDVSTNKKYKVEQIPCAFFFTSRKILEQTGLMDENYFLFFEDVDLSFRIHKDYKLEVDTSLSVTHLGGSSFKSDNNWCLHGRFIISMVYFFEKHYGKTRTFILKFLVRINSYTVIIIENVMSFIGKGSSHRLNKHKYLIKLLKENG